jgi:AraC-like DNA-binding protein
MFMIFLIFVSFSVITAFLAAILAGKKGKNSSDVILAVWLGFSVFHAVVYFLYVAGVSYRYTFLLGLDMPLVLIHGPFLYVYVLSMTQRLPSRKIFRIAHFLPTVILYVSQIPFFVTDSAGKVARFRTIETVPDMYSRIKFWLIVVSGFLYIALSIRTFLRYEKMENPASGSTVNSRWIRYSIGQMFFIWFIMLLLDITMPDTVHRIGFAVTGIGVIYFLVFMAYYGMMNTGVYVPNRRGILPEEGASPSGRYLKSGLKDAAADKIEAGLGQMMEKEKAYLNQEISLRSCAERIGVNQNHLSQVINERFKLSFWDYINRYRVAEFKSRIGEIRDKKETILSLALACGFNSKSSFNTVFRKFEAVSPRDFISGVQRADNPFLKKKD